MIRSGLNSNATTVGFSPVLGRLSCLQTTRASRASQKSSHTVPQVLLKHISTRPSSSVTPPTSLTSPSAHAVKAGFQFSQWFMLLYTDNNSYYYGIWIQYPDFGCPPIPCLLNRLHSLYSTTTILIDTHGIQKSWLMPGLHPDCCWHGRSSYPGWH